MSPKYHLNIFWSVEDDCWIADVPDLKYCSAHGETATQAAAEAEVAIGLFIESLIAHGDPIPEPRYRPAIYAMKAAA
jgi:predicted RNase H-like HicB family nuclease